MKKAVLVVNCYPKENSEYAWLNFVRSVSKRIKSRPRQTFIPDFNMGGCATKEKIEMGNHCVLNVPVSLLLNSGVDYIFERYKKEYDCAGYLILDAIAPTSEAVLDKWDYATITNMMRFHALDFYSFTNAVDFLVHGYIKKTVNDAYGTMTSKDLKENKYMQNDVINTVRAYGNWINIGKSSHTIKNVIFNNPATIVFWEDGTKTVVKCSDKDVFDPEKGIAMAFTKKILGNKDRYYNEIKKWLPEDHKNDLSYDGYEEDVKAGFIAENKYGDKYDTRFFYAGKKHKIVCAGDCYHVRNIKKENALVYGTLSAAVADGCVLCKHCMGKHKEEK